MNRVQNSDTEQFKNLELLAKQVVEGFIVGMHRSPFHGFSVEFSEYRQYNPGENVRNIDWKVYGRTDRLYTKRYEEETNLRCSVLIDTSQSMYHPVSEKTGRSKYQFSALATASLFYLFRRQRDAFGLTLFHDEIEYSTKTASSQKHFRRLLVELEKRWEPRVEKKGTNLIDVIHENAEILPPRSLVIIFSDMFEDFAQQGELFDALQHLRFNRHEVILFHTLHADQEIEFNFENRPYEFVDAESGERIKVKPGELQKIYLEVLKEYKTNLEHKCLQYKIDYIPVDINDNFDTILKTYLTKRQKILKA